MVKKAILMFVCACVWSAAWGQLSLKTTVNEAELNTLKAEFQELAGRKEVQRAVEKGAQLSEWYVIAKQYREAADICMQMDLLIYPYDQRVGRTSYDLRFMVAKERLRIYTREADFQKAKTQLNQMNYCMKYLNNDNHTDNALLTQAEYYHAFGMDDKSLDCYNQLLQRNINGKNDEEKESSFKNLIAYAEQGNNPVLSNAVQKIYTAWQDSIGMIRAAGELKALKAEHDTLLVDLTEKEKKIGTDKAVIVGLWSFIVIILAALAILFFLFMRSIYRIRKLQKSLHMANDSNAQKSAFISNINTQISPNLEAIEEGMNRNRPTDELREKLNDLKKDIADMQTYISLEEVVDETYPSKNVDISQLCKHLMEQVKPDIAESVESVVDAPRISIKTNPEALEQILGFLLARSARLTERGKILLEFKKRNARTGQFIITDTGVPIDAELQEDIFKPFGITSPTLKSDTWGLPICKLIAHKLNGTLKLDPEYKRGARFILDLCS